MHYIIIYIYIHDMYYIHAHTYGYLVKYMLSLCCCYGEVGVSSDFVGGARGSRDCSSDIISANSAYSAGILLCCEGDNRCLKLKVSVAMTAALTSLRGRSLRFTYLQGHSNESSAG